MSELARGPSIPASEYPARWRRVQEMMAARSLDLLLAYADDRATFGPAHARWLANFPVHFEPACVVLPARGQPVMLVGPESDQYARLVGTVPDVRVMRELTHPDEDYPYARIQPMAEILADIGVGAAKRVGIGGKGLMGAELLSAAQAALPGAAWVDCEGALCQLRARKSADEVAVIRHAYSIAARGFDPGVAAIRAGVTERAVAAEIDAAMRRAGSEGTGIDTIVASGPHTRPILARSTFRVIEKNDLVLLTIAPRYEGYHAAIGRVVLVGSPPAEVEAAMEAAIAAQEACGRALRPGVEGRAVEAIGRKVVAEAGLGQYFLYSGVHSLGIIEFEPPIFGPSSPAVLEEDMVVSIDIPLFNAPWGGLRIENGYLVTGGGAQPLHDTPLRIRK